MIVPQHRFRTDSGTPAPCNDDMVLLLFHPRLAGGHPCFPRPPKVRCCAPAPRPARHSSIPAAHSGHRGNRHWRRRTRPNPMIRHGFRPCMGCVMGFAIGAGTQIARNDSAPAAHADAHRRSRHGHGPDRPPPRGARPGGGGPGLGHAGQIGQSSRKRPPTAYAPDRVLAR